MSEPSGGVLAVIPARSGSRRITSKNTRLVAGRPLIAWTIEAARLARGVSRVIVSTDAEDIAALARDAGAEVPELRPAALAADDTPGTLPILHEVERLETRESYRPDYVVVLQPTSPLRTSGDIEAAIDLARRRRARSVASVCRVPFPRAWVKRVGPNDELLDGQPEAPAAEDPLYVLNGAIYLVERETLLRRRSLYADDPLAYVMPPERSLDIDTPWELHLADLALRFRFEAVT